MASMYVPSKEWMTMNRASLEYINGVQSFIQFTKAKLGTDKDWYICPCAKCKNERTNQTAAGLYEHLICNGIDKSYKIWYMHGESFPRRGGTSIASTSENPVVDMLNDVFPSMYSDGMDEVLSENDVPDHGGGHEGGNNEGGNNGGQNTTLHKLMEDAVKPLYPSCRAEHTRLSVTIELLSLKHVYSWSNQSFTHLLQLLKKILPDQNTLPDRTYTAKKLVKDLRMDNQIIHACPNDCILYWRENADLDACPKCGESRWKLRQGNNATTKKLPNKKLRYFPLTPRLKRLYSVPWIAEEMVWHSKAKPNKTHMRHPMDSSQWALIDRTWNEFALEKRNVRLGLATDGFNPFGMKNNSYSCWPVMIVPYNLPPSLCMRKEFTMLSLLIPGKKGPGHDIDVYLQPLIAELNALWSTGVDTYDSRDRSTFNMRAILMWAIHDFPAYGHLSGCRTAGKYGCPVCADNTESEWLHHGKKFAYMGSRKFLTDPNHKFRSQKLQFNGKEEVRFAPSRLTGSEMLDKMENIQNTFGKPGGTKRKRSNDSNVSSAWSKRSIFFDLPYWKNLHVRHNLDVMHVEKNVAEIIFATIMDVKGKTKDDYHARLDLRSMKIRRKMWPIEETNDKVTLPKASFCLSLQERKLVCETLHSMKVPIGYSANWKHNVCLEEYQLKSLKSHDYHILLQHLLPVLLMHLFKERDQKPLRMALKQLSTFFRVICSKVIDINELRSMKAQMVEILCVFEKYFPPGFFVSMIHVMVHLADEVMLCGNVRYRWMYHFEQMMKTYKSYVGNQTYPEGCIAERYLMQESMSYCMEYMTSVNRQGTHRAGQKMLDADQFSVGSMDKNGKPCTLTPVHFEQVRRWVLQRHPENDYWVTKYNQYKTCSSLLGGGRQRNISKTMEYIPWLRLQLRNHEMSTFKRLADGPVFNVISYNCYTINGYIFCTSDYEKNATTQNSGVSIDAVTQWRSSARDRNYVVRNATYYGIIRQILELNYYDFKEVVFLCDWVRIEDRVNGYYEDVEIGLRYVNLTRINSNASEPFILAKEASQVFYVKDVTRDDWYVVLDAPKRLNRDADAYEDPLVFEARMNSNNSGTGILDDAVDYNESEYT